MDSTEILDEIPTEIPFGRPILEEFPSLDLEVKQKLQEVFWNGFLKNT